MPKVSVIIPTYNRERLFRRAVDSVLNQTFRDFEVIVVDDGSSDGTREGLATYGEKIKYIYQENKGISKARNRGILESRGEYIAFLDSDDYWVQDKLIKQVLVLDINKKVGIVFSRMPIVDENGKIIGRKPSGVCGRNFRELIEIWGDLPTSTVMTRRECLDKVGLFDTSLPSMEDIDMWLRISRFYDIYEIKGEVLAYYSRHGAQTTKSRIAVYEGLVGIHQKILREYSDIPRDLIEKRYVFNQYILAREHGRLNEFPKALRNTLAAIGRYPLLGILFLKKEDGLGAKVLKIIKPYGFLLACVLRWLGSGCLLGTEGAQRSPLKILFVHEHHDNIAGQELSLLDRLTGLREVGIDCAVLLPGDGIFAELLRKNGFEIKYLRLNHLGKKGLFSFLKTVFGIRRIMRDGHFSFIHCSGIYPNQYSLPAARLCGRLCVVHINTIIYGKHDLKRNLVTHADFIFTVCESVRQKILNTIKIPRDKIMTVYDGISDDKNPEYSTGREELRKQLNILPGQKVVGQISSVIPRKGFEYFVKMARIVKDNYPDVKFLIIGRIYDKEYGDGLARLSRELKLDADIAFVDFQEDIYRFIDLLDVSVLASDAEGLGRVIVQSQMIGKPVVATDVGGSTEAIVDQKTGFVVPPANPQALAKAVLELLENPQKANMLGESAKPIALAKFNIRQHANALKDVYFRMRK